MTLTRKQKDVVYTILTVIASALVVVLFAWALLGGPY
jgi:preprotein translocase subunit SecE